MYRVSVLALALTAPALAAPPAVKTPDFLPGGDNAQFRALSSNGLVGAGNGNTPDGFFATRSDGLAFSLIPGLPSLGINGLVEGANGDGSVLVGQAGGQAFHWTPALTTIIPTLAAFPQNAALDVSDNGLVVTGFGVDDSDIRRAWRWTVGDAAPTELGDPANAPAGLFLLESGVRSISADGSTIIGYAAFDDGSAFPTRWTAATGLRLIEPAGTGFATDVSANGNTVVGWNFPTGDQSIAFVYDAAANTIVQVQPLPGDTFSEAWGVSADGSTVAGTSGAIDPDTGTATSRLFLWTTATGPRDVAELLSAQGLDFPAGYSQPSAARLSADGLTIAANAFDPCNRFRGLLISLAPAGTPTATACCTGTTCTVTADPAACRAAAGTPLGISSVCGPTSCCEADINASGAVDVADIFTFLSAWFAQASDADFDGSCAVDVADIFSYLSAWFAGC